MIHFSADKQMYGYSILSSLPTVLISRFDEGAWDNLRDRNSNSSQYVGQRKKWPGRRGRHTRTSFRRKYYTNFKYNSPLKTDLQ